MAFIAEDKLLEIKDAALIEEVVGGYVQLTKKGKNLLGLCPFHADTSPSFTVAPEKGIFHCFGCGAGGNVFSFIMAYHRLSFPEAAHELARRYNIPLAAKDLGPEGSRQAQKRTLAYEITKAAAAFFAATLNSPEGKPGRDYLARRGLTPEIIRNFQLGYAPEGWDHLKRFLQAKNYSLELAQEVGLLVAKERGGFYDRFRGRIIFPIFDRQSRPVAFGGRILDTGEPKYLNSPESLLYSKGRLLYGLPQAADALRASGVALVVEGYLDLLALQVKGIAGVLATLGTALTREQVRLLKSLAARVVLVFDGDAAGIKAMQRAIPLFTQEGVPVRMLALPAGLDPDDYARRHGVEIFQNPWEAAQPWFIFLLEDLIRVHGQDIEGRVKILEELRPYLRDVPDLVERDLWLKEAGSRLGVDEALLRRSVSSLTPVTPARLNPQASLAVNRERSLIGWILAHPEAVGMEELEEWADEFVAAEFRELLALIIGCYRQHGRLDHGLLVQDVREHQRQQLCALTLEEEEAGALAGDPQAEEWRRDLQMRRLKRTQHMMKERLGRIGAAGDETELFALLAQCKEIDRQLENLKSTSNGKGENG